jgi:iron(III) transport system ATP-binding protein
VSVLERDVRTTTEARGPTGVDREAASGQDRSPAYLSAVGLTKSFGRGDSKATVVRDVTFDIPKSEFVCVLGPSGCGKTTLLRLIAGFEPADSGSIRQDGREIASLPPEARDFGIVFQSYALFPNRTVTANVAYGLEATGMERTDRGVRVGELLALVGLADHAGKYPSQLSGGQQQRVALARALALSPGLLLLDEPLSALDANVRASLRDELRALQLRVGVTTLMVTHDQQEALSIADRLIVMNAGRIEQSGKPADVYDRPANVFVARFLGEMNALPVVRVGDGHVLIGENSFALDRPIIDVGPVHRFCIRPAAVAIGPDAAGESNGFIGHILQVAFRGDHVRMKIAMPRSGDLVLEADAPRARLAATPAPGDSIAVALPARHCLLLPGEG